MLPEDTQAIIGQSSNFVAVLEHVSQLGELNRPVLVAGERGTGKELIVERLHYLSARWDQNFLKVNCAALPETLLESELFGHEIGAFTGASRRHAGLFERADEGSLFLDEITSMSPRLQEKILRVIEYGEFERLGGSDTLRVDVRLIAATNVDLPSLAATGGFRADLLDRLAFDVITLPPLRARTDDIPLLAEHFALAMVKELRRKFFPGFTAAAIQTLLAHDWPGNVRELKNVIERAVFASHPGTEVTDIVLDPFSSPWRLPLVTLPTNTVASAQPCPDISTTAIPADLKKHISEIEKDILQAALQASHYHQRQTAASLGLSYHQLRGYLKKYELIGTARAQ